MPGRQPPLVTNYYYHIYNRGVELRPIFTEKRDYQYFWKILSYYRFSNFSLSFSKIKRLTLEDRDKLLKSLKKQNKLLAETLCFCLMPNHFHLVLKQKMDNGISQFLSNLQNSYTRYFNKKHKRIGVLFQGTFKAVLIETEQQLLHLSRYVHLNPYSSAVVKNLNKLFLYPWSSLSQYFNNQLGFCQTETIKTSFPQPQDYKNFLVDRADYQRKLEQVKHLLLD